MSKAAKTLRKLALMRAKEREATFQAREQRRAQEETLEETIEQQNKKAIKEEEMFEERSHGERRYIPATDRISTADARARIHSLAEQFLQAAEKGRDGERAIEMLSQIPKLLKESRVTAKLNKEVETFAEAAGANLAVIFNGGTPAQITKTKSILSAILTQLRPKEESTVAMSDLLNKYPTVAEVAEAEARAVAEAQAIADAQAAADAAKAQAIADAQAVKEANEKAKVDEKAVADAEKKAKAAARKNTQAQKRAAAKADAILAATSPELQTPAAAASSGYRQPMRVLRLRESAAPAPAAPSPGMAAAAAEEFKTPAKSRTGTQGKSTGKKTGKKTGKSTGKKTGRGKQLITHF